LKEKLGCETPTQEAVWEDEDDVFFNCPIRFITENVWAFIKKYDAIKNGICRPKEYEQTAARFIQAANFFEKEILRFTKAKEPKDHGSMNVFKKAE